MKPALIVSFLFFLTIGYSNKDTTYFDFDTTKDSIVPGDEFCVEFLTRDFIDIIGFQSELQWDSTELVYLGSFQVPGSLIGPMTFNEEDVALGKLPFLWTNANALPQTLLDGRAMFQVCFRASESFDKYTYLRMDNSLVYTEDENGEYCESSLILLNGYRTAAVDHNVILVDNDGDGYYDGEDCDDNNPEINPNAEEIPDNGIDEDCDGQDDITSSSEFLAPTLSVFPNPAKDLINIQCAGHDSLLIRLMDARGKLLGQYTNEKEIDVSSLENGTYFMVIKTNEASHTHIERIIIM